MSSRDEILARLCDLLRDELEHHGALATDSRLAEDLGLDSIQLMTLAVAVEDRFEICLEESDERSIETLDDLVGVIAERRRAAVSDGTRD